MKMDVLSYQQIVDFLLSSAEKRKWPEKILVSKILAPGYLLYGHVQYGPRGSFLCHVIAAGIFRAICRVEIAANNRNSRHRREKIHRKSRLLSVLISANRGCY